ncbi:hypothetical protein [Synechococcus sp. BS55D]|uniref:hypothetical protein n=1 Tax=Synechococcus sp. BS55D TaxID=2055943 RepID=UPI001F3CBEC9|nr:hypothetical protein [Synechococcus sp. BS55D]
MLWLIAIVLVLQAATHWLISPVVGFASPLFDLGFLPWLLALTGLWLLAGRAGQS